MAKLGELISQAKVVRCGSGDYPVLSMTMHDGIVKQSGRFKKAIASKDTSTYKVVQPGQLVVGFPIDEGVIYVQNFDEPGIMSPAYNVWDIDLGKVQPAYLELALHSPQSMLYYAKKMRGTTARRRSITPNNLCAMELPLPSMERQVEIVALFGLIRTQIEKGNQQLSKLDELVKSRFIEMFGATPEQMLCKWDHAPLLSCVESIDSGKSVNCKAEPRNELEPGVLKLSALSSGAYLSSENKAMPDGCEVVPGKEVCFGDILVARKNTPELVGACVLVKEDTPNLMFPDLVFRMHPLESIDAIYLTALLGISPFSNSVRALAHGSAKSMSNIPKTDLGKLQVPLPPIELQCEFASFVAQIDKLEFAARQQIEKLQTLYDSLAQSYFGGQED
ncbi:restriction endonuclease subunit S [Eggerthellaceae bacterium zg-1084]|uniref:restriction endonuclease subunit S n=1 Tax=Berryella wangjianweii TaxID=2734634 RepID=UPI001552ED18|nr:restriction endonuclease subunit S [Berryella wangjianweii]NPD30991.1 restriction endonuclease subunit S [Berryella wangjianweii]